ncbi:MAG: hypothetical protein R3245_06150 [Kiloniellales bacterium]|nr:hypothetical protein [Kiloniellales bacterium]
MAAKIEGDKGWGVTVLGDNERPENDKIIVTRYDPPRLTFELRVPSIRHAGEKQGQVGYRAHQDAVDRSPADHRIKSATGTFIRKTRMNFLGAPTGAIADIMIFDLRLSPIAAASSFTPQQ